MSRLKAWWSQPDHYDSTTVFLRQRGMLRSARTILAGITGSSALVPLTVLPSQQKPSAVEVITGVVAATFTVGVTILWLRGWPTRRQSQAGVAVAALCLGGWSLVQPTAALAALACTALAISGCYIAFFHSPKLLVFNGVVAVVVATVAVLRLAHEASVAAAASAFWLNTFMNFWLPLGIWGISRAMGTYALRSEEDALTGLLNRRAFTDAVGNRLSNPPPAHTHLAVVMIDLDNFKRINDTYGHSAGDQTLRTVADLLRGRAPADAVICRAGGEEFLVALTSDSRDVEPLAAELCTALAELSPMVTASIGTASAELCLLTEPDVARRVDELIASADTAMYAAKRRGGNQAHHSVRT
jgi:diguanylate cyclase (GGDEF)-like protein